MFRITLTQEHLNVISAACELLSRVRMGQLDVVADYMPDHMESQYDVRDAMRKLEPKFSGLQGGHYSISSPEINNDARLAFDIHQLIRQTLSYERKREGNHTVDRNDPFVYGGLPLPTLERVDPEQTAEDRLCELLAPVANMATEEFRGKLIQAGILRPDGAMHPRYRRQIVPTDEMVVSCVMGCLYPGSERTAMEIRDWVQSSYDNVTDGHLGLILSALQIQRRIISDGETYKRFE